MSPEEFWYAFRAFATPSSIISTSAIKLVILESSTASTVEFMLDRVSSRVTSEARCSCDSILSSISCRS